MFSAANETRIGLKNKLRSPLFLKMVESKYRDFDKISKAVPSFKSSDIVIFSKELPGEEIKPF